MFSKSSKRRTRSVLFCNGPAEAGLAAAAGAAVGWAAGALVGLASAAGAAGLDGIAVEVAAATAGFGASAGFAASAGLAGAAVGWAAGAGACWPHASRR